MATREDLLTGEGGTGPAAPPQRPPRPAASRPAKRRRLPARLVALVAVALVFAAVALGVPTPAEVAGGDYAQLPVRFEPNNGQSDPAVRYIARAGGATAFLTDTQVAVVPRGVREAVVVLRFVGGSPEPAVRGLDRLGGLVHHLRGDDPDGWTTAVPTYAGVRYDGVYPGVDAVFRDDGQGNMAYDLHVAPGADPDAITLAFAGAGDVTVDAAGDLVLDTPAGEVRHSAPVVYQEHSGARHAVDGAFVVHPDGTVGFELGAYDPAHPLVIDPVLTYATYLSGAGADTAQGIAVDDAGAAHVAGVTASADFPVTDGAVDTEHDAGTDVFVAKLTPDGSDLEYATFIGGAGADAANGIDLDATGAAYVTGFTESDDFPATDGAFQGARAGAREAFVAKLAPGGGALAYATYLGGGGADTANDIAVDADGAAYLTGVTGSTDFPTAAAYEDLRPGETAAFVTQLAPDGASLAFSTYLGGAAADVGRSVAVDADGSAYVTGETSSSHIGLAEFDGFPIVDALQDQHLSQCQDTPPQNRCVTAFVTKFAPGGASLEYSTFLGGTTTSEGFLGVASDQGFGIAVDDTEAVYVLGHTTTDNFPTTAEAFQTENAGEHDWFLSKLVPDGSALAYSTYVGGPSQEVAWDLDVDDEGAAYAIGMANTGGFPTVDPVDRYAGNEEALAAKVSPDGSALEWSTYLGSSTSDHGLAVAVGPGGSAFLTGRASGFSPHDDFPTTPGSFQPERAGTAFGGESFVARIDPLDEDVPLVTAVNPPSGPVAGATIVTLTGRGFTADTTVSFGDEPAAELVHDSPTQLRALTPPGELGTVPVVVANAAGTSPANPVSHFEYAEGVWRPTGAMVQARNAHSDTLLDDGRVLVAGGRESRQGPALATAEIYDPATDTWSATGAMATARFNHTATLLDDGTVLVAGGFGTGLFGNAQPFPGDAELYDPATGEWSPAGELVARRAAHTATLLEDGSVLLAGGRTCDQPPPATCGPPSFTASAELYDPATGEFTATGAMAFARHSYASLRMSDGRVMVAGGFSQTPDVLIEPTVEIYDPATGEWTGTGDLAAGRVRGVLAQLEEGGMLHVGGALSYQFTEIWDPGTGEWTLQPPMPTGRHNYYGTQLPDGDVLAAGGGLGGIRAEIFDTQTRTWSSAGQLNTALGSSHLLARTHEGLVLEDGSVLHVGNADEPVAERYVRDPEPEQLLPPVEGCPDVLPIAPFTDRELIPDAHRANVDCAAELDIVQGFTDGSYGPALQVRRDQMASFIARTLDAAGVALPAPAGDRFDDVGAGSVHDEAIHRLAAADIVLGGAGGLPATSYGPSQSVRRDQMTSFLVRAAEFATEEALASDEQAFDDVGPANTHFANVNGASEAGLAQGFGDGTFRPGEGVRRDQMASFVVRLVTGLAEGTIGG